MFKKNGVEIFDDDFEYLKDKDIIYVSQGEEFNQESILGEYETIKELGKGGFGTVYLASSSDSQLVAIKHVQKNILTSN